MEILLGYCSRCHQDDISVLVPCDKHNIAYCGNCLKKAFRK